MTRHRPKKPEIWRILRPGGLLPTAFCLLGLLATPALAHSPTLDGNLWDWCVRDAPRSEDRAATLRCPVGEEIVWWDAPADAAVNDLSVVATTSDATHLFWGIALHLNPDPISLPMLQIAIDAGPGGNNSWQDPQAKLRTPGYCSVDTDRRCTKDEDCHFCAVTTVYTGTPNERPQVCGSTDLLDACTFEPGDFCIRNQTCQGLAAGTPIPSAGANAIPTLAPDYLLVFDFGRWLIGACDSVTLLRADSGGWVEIPRPVPDPFCVLPTWRFPLVVAPGTGETGPPPEVELGVPWEAFDCPGCVPFGPGDEFRWTAEINRSEFTLNYEPDGAVEDVMSEAVAGRWTTTPDACATPGTATTLCETADGSTDAFVSTTPQDAGGNVDGLTATRDDDSSPSPSITLSWDPSCTNADIDYQVYEGEIGQWFSHAPPVSGAVCSTDGATQVGFEAGPGDHYYLVVPGDGVIEGSYGESSNGAPRPAATSACLPQSPGNCP